MRSIDAELSGLQQIYFLEKTINREIQQIYFITSWKKQQRNPTNLCYYFLEKTINREIQQISVMTSWKTIEKFYTIVSAFVQQMNNRGDKQ